MSSRTIKLSRQNAYAFMEEGLRRYQSLKDNEEVAGIRVVSSGYEVDIRTTGVDYMPSETEPRGK